MLKDKKKEARTRANQEKQTAAEKKKKERATAAEKKKLEKGFNIAARGARSRKCRPQKLAYDPAHSTEAQKSARCELMSNHRAAISGLLDLNQVQN